MTIPPELPIEQILVEDRQRIDHTNTDGLKESIQTLGLIQPIVLELLPDGHDSGCVARLIAGGRRLLFSKELGYTSLYRGVTCTVGRPGYVLSCELPKDVLRELELEENVRRKPMSWQERALGLADLHRLKLIRYGGTGQEWGHKETGELLGVSRAHVSNSLRLAQLLASDKKHPLWSVDGPLEGLRWVQEQRETELLREKAKRQVEMTKKLIPGVKVTLETALASSPILSAPEPVASEMSPEKAAAFERYKSNPLNPPNRFEEYWAAKQGLEVVRQQIVITPRLFHGSCLTYLADKVSMFDHIVTDPPYAIDVSSMDQTNLGMTNIDSIKDAHQVDANMALLTQFIPLAFRAIKEHGFLVLWADYSRWDFLYQTATAAGFKVQSWPVVWVKTHTCQNSAAQYNFTKTTEIAVICRKGNAVLAKQGTLGHIVAAHDEYKTKLNHPFVKPYAVWEHIVDTISIKGQSVLDPFAGRGSGVLSLIRMERNWFACELEEHHYVHLLNNIKEEYLRSNPNANFV